MFKYYNMCFQLMTIIQKISVFFILAISMLLITMNITNSVNATPVDETDSQTDDESENQNDNEAPDTGSGDVTDEEASDTGEDESKEECESEPGYVYKDGTCQYEEEKKENEQTECEGKGWNWEDGKCKHPLGNDINDIIVCSGDKIPDESGAKCIPNPKLKNLPYIPNCGFAEKCCSEPGYIWDEYEQKCKKPDKKSDNRDTTGTTKDRSDADNCPKSFIVAVDTLRLPGCLVSSANGIGTINFLERNFDNIIVGNNMLPNVLLSFTLDDLGTTSSGMSVITQLNKITSAVGISLNIINQVQMAFTVDWRPEVDTSSNNFTYCHVSSGSTDCETERYDTTF